MGPLVGWQAWAASLQRRKGWLIIPILGNWGGGRGEEHSPTPSLQLQPGQASQRFASSATWSCTFVEFHVILWFQIPSECLLLASPFVSLAQISPSGCSRSPLDLLCSNRAHLLPFLHYHCSALPQLSRCHPCSPRCPTQETRESSWTSLPPSSPPSQTPSVQSPGPVCSLPRYFLNPSTSLLAPLSLSSTE